jgi:RIO-like serine/threonine protein kinase
LGAGWNIEVLRELKRDSFGRVELVRLGSDREREGELCIRRVACGGAVPGSRLVARMLMRREQTALVQLAGLVGVPRVLHGSSAELLRSFEPGVALSQTEELAVDFFEQLRELVEQMHARGVCHNDLHKEQNVIVGLDGRPCLVDFQLASLHPRPGRLARSRMREDLRHVEKHRRRYMREGRGPAGEALELAALPALKRSRTALVWRRTAKPLYNFVTRRLMGTRDGEARRRSDGSWPRWTAARGPRP